MNAATTTLPPPDATAQHLADARSLARTAALVLLFGLVPAFAWIALAPLSSAVVAPAFVKVDLNRRPVQHAEGGMVREVRVRDGDRVHKGDTLLVLGDVSVDADANRLAYRVDAERASIARLDAEQAYAPAIEWPRGLLAAAAADPRLAEQITKEKSLFATRRLALTSQSALLRLQREKVAQEMTALRTQIAQAAESMALQKTDLENNRGLLKDGYIAATRITQLEAVVADYGVKLSERHSELARAEQRLLDIDLKLRAIESEYRQQASDQWKVTASRLQEIEQELRKSTDASARQVIVAPADGEVMGLKVTAPGAVIPPRETIADIVPANPKLVIEARVHPEDINRVHVGQAADIRFTAFKARTTKLVAGKVIYISGDSIVDREANQAYYSVQVEADAQSLGDAGDLKLLAGMPAEVYLKGEQRTPLDYLLEPITQVMHRAGRER
ncbi:MAG: HlyD family type I secretion periplasmic adaptor subunit [Burkholderiaceae bacterium]